MASFCFDRLVIKLPVSKRGWEPGLAVGGISNFSCNEKESYYKSYSHYIAQTLQITNRDNISIRRLFKALIPSQVASSAFFDTSIPSPSY